ncbi:MAG: YegS/Rv2252/BmrU family lipid kinase [Clostridia bacterium]|nr:YegS/Rv2252/BmrU family lipid kinase [Clostridia bacterium]
MKRMLFIVNPNAGQRRVNRFMPEIIRLFIDGGYRCETYVTGHRQEATSMLRDSHRRYDLVVCAGGDGTLNETVAGMLEAGMKCPLGYIPCGTTNDYASSIGLSQDVLQAAGDILSGRPQTLDVGSFNGRYFVYTATCGAFAKASYSTPQAAKNVLGHVAYILEGMRDLTAIKPIHMRITADDLVLEDDFLFCSVTNSTSVGGILKLDSQLVALNDGRFEVTLVRNPVNPAQLGSIFVGLSTQSIPNDMIHFFSARSICVEVTEPVEWTLDGEREPESSMIRMRNLHSAIRLIVPGDSRSVSFENAVEEAEL